MGSWTLESAISLVDGGRIFEILRLSVNETETKMIPITTSLRSRRDSSFLQLDTLFWKNGRLEMEDRIVLVSYIL